MRTASVGVQSGCTVPVHAALCGVLSAYYRALLLAAVSVLAITGPVGAFAQAYTSIVVFGDSLSDVGNDAALSSGKYGLGAQVPGPVSGYTNGRFTDGPDTLPAARNYQGVWVEQLAAKLAAKPVLTNSLAGGTDYAYGFATTNSGTSPFTYGPGNALSFSVNNMALQVSTYLATSPKINSQTLFIVWGGANDLIAATSTNDVIAAANREIALVNTLLQAGATDIIVPNLPPLGLVPRFNGSTATSGPPTAAAAAFNQVLASGLTAISSSSAGKVRLYQLDTFSLFKAAVGPPIGYGLANVTASSQGNATINPDMYLFWDDLHPTTYGHSLLAASALTLLGPTVTTTTALASSSQTANVGSSVTFTATVAAASTTPVGTVTFFDGSATLGAMQLSGSGTTATAAYTTTALTAGTHTITATYTGVNGLGSSTSPALSELIVPPSFAATVSPTSLTVSRGSSGTATLTVTPAGGYTGAFTLTCGTLPAHMSCAFAPASLSVTGASAATSTLTLNTATAVSRNTADPILGRGTGITLASLALPATLLLGLSRRKRRSLPMLLLFAALSSGAFIGLTGCGGDPYANDTLPGTYQVQVSVAPASGATTTLTLPVTVQ